MEDSAQQHQEVKKNPLIRATALAKKQNDPYASGSTAHRGVADTSAWTAITPPYNKNAKHDSKHTWNHFLLRLDRFINHLNC